jgi:predicted SnoaL-like aldol condensation-catalyzing enzyme
VCCSRRPQRPDRDVHTGIEVFRVLDDKIVEYWGEANMSELFASSEAPESATVG